MDDRNGRLSRRDALRIALGVGAGLALRPGDLWAHERALETLHEAGWDDLLQSTSLVTKPIPSSGERLPVVGIGTARRYDVAASEADVTLVGIGGGTAQVGFGSIAYDAAVRVPYWGSRSELIEVLDLARSGRVSVETQRYSLDDGPAAYEALAAGTVRGRAVIVP